MTIIDSLKEQQQLGLQATLYLNEYRRMERAMAAWDELKPAEKAREYADHFNPDCAPSRFYEVPGFEPLWCEDCNDFVHADFRDDPEGACPLDAVHELWLRGMSDRAAA